MSLTFPASPTVGDTYTVGARTWSWSGTIWEMTGTVAVAGSIGTAELASSAVTTAKIAAGAVTAAKLGNDISLTPADGSITQAKLTSGLSGITATTTSLRSSVITSPFAGQFAFMTDTNAFIRWDGSAWVTAIVTVPSEAPTSLALVSATTTTATISFAEGATGGSAITNYQYALSTNSGSSYGSYNALATPDGTTPITISGLVSGTAYYIKLKAVNAQGASTAESNALSFSTSTLSLSVEYLVVAGGGGAGTGHGGGGGAGGLRTNMVGASSGGGAAASAAMLLVVGTYGVTVGAGAARLSAAANTTAYTDGGQGSNSVFNAITSLGGGFGGGWDNRAAANGGSGGGRGGGSSGYTSGGAGTTSQGYAGGTNALYCGGGGGGAGGAGGTATSSAAGGAGGAGVNSSITGSSIGYAGGGGGGAYPSNAVGGTATHGGANGNALDYGTPGTGGFDAVANKGGGGGGSGGNWATGGAGGSGIVIVRYLTADAPVGITITGGTATTSGTYTVRTFLASGSLVIA